MICAARPANQASIAKISVPQGRISARSVKAQFKVTLDTPEGVKEIECAADEYILDAAEVRAGQWWHRIHQHLFALHLLQLG
jgi:hypothetical protein